MVEFNLTGEQQLLRAEVKKFAQREIRPVVLEREGIQEPRKRFPWDIIKKLSQLGLRTLGVPTEFGGPEASVLTRCIVCEELASADVGIATALDITWRYSKLVAKLGSKELGEQFFQTFLKDDTYLMGGALTEPQHGTDHLIAYEGANFSTTAELSNNEWVLNGVKVFISNALEAKAFVVFVATDTSKSFRDGASAFFVPRDTPGFKLGEIYKKSAQVLNSQGELIFENCRIPQKNLLGLVNENYAGMRAHAKESGAEHAAMFMGIAAGAYRGALEYACQRVQGGRPIIQHQAVGMKLAEMLCRLEAARTMLWRAAWAVDNQELYDYKMGSIVRYCVANEALIICQRAAEVCGCNAEHDDFFVQKCLRDIMIAHVVAGSQDANLIKIMQALISERGSK